MDTDLFSDSEFSFVHEMDHLQLEDEADEHKAEPETGTQASPGRSTGALEAPRSYLSCPECGVDGRIIESKIACLQCGLTRNWEDLSDDVYDKSIQENHNTSSNGFASFQIMGKGCNDLHQSYRNACTQYNNLRRFSILQELESKVYQYQGREIPQTVIEKTVTMFESIRELGGRVFRGNGRQGVIGACMFYAFVEIGQTRTPKEIAEILSIEEKYVSQGDKRLIAIAKQGAFVLPETQNSTHDFVEQFLAQLRIDMKYKAFVLDLIDRAHAKRLHIYSQCRITTKCAGAIYVLCTRVPELRRQIDKQLIADTCKISKSTFLRYYNLIMDNHVLVEKSFYRHGIPMPTAWRRP